MQKALVNGLTVAIALSPAVGWTQSGSAPKAATYITAEEVQTVNKTPGVDRQIRVVDIGDQNFAVGIIHRGATGAAARGTGAAAGGGAQAAAGAARAGGAAAGAGAGRAAGAGAGAAAGAQAGRGAAAQGEACGETASGAPSAGSASGISHDKQTEGYLIVSGAGTMVTGGHIVNGRKSGPDNEVTTTLN